jgi:dTDP-4-dehydrorhamnose 3,5-epimerase
MNVTATELSGVLILEPRVHGDERGFLLESWNEKTLREMGLDLEFVQDNHSFSRHGTLRGLHYQIEQPQGKLVRVATGEVFDVAVDMRQSSPTLGRWTGVWLTEENHTMLWVPPGFAHGFYVASDSAHFLYKCTDFYAPEHSRTVSWDDPELAIEWPLADDARPSLSAGDRKGTPFREAELFR